MEILEVRWPKSTRAAMEEYGKRLISLVLNRNSKKDAFKYD